MRAPRAILARATTTDAAGERVRKVPGLRAFAWLTGL
jgi:hypothetical protein